MNEQTPTDKIIEQNRAALELIPIDDRGVSYQNFLMVADRARAMAKGRASVPAFLKGNEPDCIAVVELAIGLGFQPVQVARLCYEVNGVMAFQSQLLHAVLNKSGILTGRIDFEYEGEGDERTCTCVGTFRTSGKPSKYTTPPLAKISPKNSPLWKTDPDQQMSYLSLSRWVRRHCPEVFLGTYTREEMLDAEPQHFGPDNAKDVTAAAAALHQRMAEAAAVNGGEPQGFHPDAVDRGLQDAPPMAREGSPRAKGKAARVAKAKPGKSTTGGPRAKAEPKNQKELL
jgi:RecT family